ncbi:MAG: questin oxidase family protein [Burkholderiaceae bacterium]
MRHFDDALAASPATRPIAAARRPRDAAGLDLLHALLDESLGYRPEYGEALLASHLPMALGALHGLGASAAQMRRFLDADARHLERVAPGEALAPAPLDDWAALRGRFDAFERLRAHFAAALARDGRDAVLREAVPALLPGTGGAAFHGAIRAAHAVESGHAGELAAALAYWAARAMVLPAPAAAAERFDTPAEWLAALDARARTADAGWRPTGRMITLKMRQASGTHAYEALAGATGGFAGDARAILLALGEAATARYAATRHFTVLHMATASRALRVLLPWAGDAGVPAAAFHAVAAASLASGIGLERPVDPPTVAPAADLAEAWEQVRALACAQDDDHVIKLVHAMADQDAQMPSTTWLAAARAAVRV